MVTCPFLSWCTGGILKSQAGTRQVQLLTARGPQHCGLGRAWQLRRAHSGRGAGRGPRQKGGGERGARAREPRARAVAPPAPAPPRPAPVSWVPRPAGCGASRAARTAQSCPQP